MKIKEFQTILRKQNIDAAIISTLLGQDVSMKLFLKEDMENSFLIIPKKGNPKLVVPKMEEGEAKKKFNLEVLPFDQPLSKQFKKLLNDKKLIGINKDSITLNSYKFLKRIVSKKKFVDISENLKQIRIIKNEDEINKITKACKITDNIFKKILTNFEIFKKETDIRKFIISECIKKGCKPAFPPLVASGRNSGYVHYLGGDRKIGKGFMFLDFGVDYKGYKSDMTRTMYVGKITNKFLKDYNNLLKIQTGACNMVKPGVKVRDIDDYVKSELGDLAEYYTHSLGHGVGLDIHEPPSVNSNAKDILKEGMVLTIEPGYYFPGKYGMRIEDTILVTNKGYKRLTKSSKQLKIIKR